MRVLPMCVLMTLLGASAVLYGQTEHDLWNQCTANDAETKIAGCTGLIQSGQLSGENLAVAFDDRGVGYLEERRAAERSALPATPW